MYIIFKMLKDFSFGLFLQFFHNYERNEKNIKKRAFFSPIFLCHFYYFQHGLSAAALLIFKYYVIHSWFAPNFFEAP